MTGWPVDLAFWILGIAAVWFGWRVFRTDSMVRATFALLASFLNVGGILVLLLAEYLGVALFFMMAVEMTVMAIFMVAFMMNPAGLNPMQMVHQQRAAVVAGVLSAVGLGAVAWFADLPSVALVAPDDTIVALGEEIMGDSMILMQTAGITLLATMIGSVALTAASGRFGDATQGSRPPALDPDAPVDEDDAQERPDPHAHHMGHADHGGHG